MGPNSEAVQSSNSLVVESSSASIHRLRNLLRSKTIPSTRVALATSLIVESVLGTLVAARSGQYLLVVLFVLSRPLVGYIASSRRKLPWAFMHFIPALNAAFIIYVSYFTEARDIASLYLFIYVILNTLSLPAVQGAGWGLFTLLGVAVSWVLIDVGGSSDPYTTYGFFLAIIVQIGLSYVISSFFNTIALSNEVQELAHDKIEAKYEALLNNVGDGLVISDTDGMISFVSKKGVSLLGLEMSQMIGQSVSATVLLRDSLGQPIRDSDYPVTVAMRSHKPVLIDQTSENKLQIVRADNTAFIASIAVSPVSVFGEAAGTIMVFHDLTEVERMSKAKSEFVSLASHQLRTPLNVVSWYAEKLLSEKKGTLNARQKDYLQEISTNNERMISLVGDLLNVSRVDLGHVEFKHQHVDLTQLVQSLVKEIEPITLKNKQKLITSIDKRSIVFEDADLSVVTVIIQNILSNAVKYTPPKGSISIAVRRVMSGEKLNQEDPFKAGAEGVVIEVVDTGLGIPEQQKDKIFEKLFRADNIQAMDVQGTGLGLYVTESFVKAMNGKIWFVSKVNKGTTFSVYLPLTSGRVS